MYKRQGIVRVEGHGGIGNGVLGVGIRDDHQITAHNGLSLAVRGGLIVDFLDFLGFQRFTADLALLVLAALAVGGRLLVDDPVTGLVACRLGVVALVAVSYTHLRLPYAVQAQRRTGAPMRPAAPAGPGRRKG